MQELFKIGKNIDTDQKHIVVITGPTAVGKSSFLLELFGDYEGPVISADSRQIYKELSIGTAKPSEEEIEALNLQLVDHWSIEEPYHAGLYEKQAMVRINDAFALGQVPILSGGTGLYLKAVAEGLDVIPEVSPEIVSVLNAQALKNYPSLVAELESKDKSYFSQIESQNRHRVIRALSVIRETGQAFSSFLNNRSPRNFITHYVVLERPRQELYARINKRVLHMMEQGLSEEVEALWELKHLKALQTVGYQEIFRYMEGKYNLDQAVSEIQKNSRRYAKRQMTWFRNQIKGAHFHPEDIVGVRQYLKGLVQN